MYPSLYRPSLYPTLPPVYPSPSAASIISSAYRPPALAASALHGSAATAVATAVLPLLLLLAVTLVMYRPFASRHQ